MILPEVDHCPCCGGEAAVRGVLVSETPCTRVECRDCGLNVWDASPEAAADKWNARATAKGKKKKTAEPAE